MAACPCRKSWKGLGDMSGTEAMRLYVRTLEEEEVRVRGWCH